MDHPRALGALIMFLLFSVGDFTAVPQLRRKSQVTGGLCAHLIQSAGFPCTEHQTKTKDGFLLGLQRVSSRSTIVRGEMGLPVLLIHGLFMDLCPESYNDWTNLSSSISPNQSEIFSVRSLLYLNIGSLLVQLASVITFWDDFMFLKKTEA